MKDRSLTKIFRRVFIGLWFAVIIVCLGYFALNPDKFKPESIALLLKDSHHAIWPIYLAISIIRGFTLLPSTPLVIAGTLMFPDHPWLVLAISMIGITLSSTLIYFCSDLLGFDEYFENRNPQLMEKIRTKLDHPLGFLFVAGWAFFPFVPTDLVCYVAGTSRMNFLKFIAAVFVGELVLCCIYIFGGGHLLGWF